jgi:hypothetical protein
MPPLATSISAALLALGNVTVLAYIESLQEYLSVE